MKDVSERGVPEWRVLLQGKEFTDDDDDDDDDGADVVFSHEDDVRYARHVIKGEKDITKNHDYAILRQVFDMTRDGGDDWVEDRFPTTSYFDFDVAQSSALARFLIYSIKT